MQALDLTQDEWRSVLGELGEKPFRAKQIWEWLHKKNAASYEEMTNLSGGLRARLAEAVPFAFPETVILQESALDGTQKYLFRLFDGNTVESVRMRYHHGNAVCISSQVGCRMGCTFCASTLGGLIRSLTPGEMLGQIYAIERAADIRVSNVVVMGMGEPLENIDNLLAFLAVLNSPEGHGLSHRSVTVSTCGIVPGIRRLIQEGAGINLALSLHAPNDAMRKRIMPVTHKYPLSQVLPAMKDYYAANGRRLTFEYTVIRGVNDSAACAEELSRLLRGMNCLVNLIAVNPVRERNMPRTEASGVQAFKKELEIRGINVTIRRELGRDIDAACGQLRRRYPEKQDT